MSKINIAPNEFPDIIMTFLFDKMLHPDEIASGNPQFDKIMAEFKKRGVITQLRDYYLNMNKDNRRKYKLIKDALDKQATTNGVISIVPPHYEQDIDKKKEGLLKSILKKLVASKEYTDEEKQVITEVLDI